MPLSKSKTPVRAGIRDALPFILVVAPFGMLFGVVGSEAGLKLVEVMGMSVLVVAGASQFAALQQMLADTPTLMVILTALTVNLRMAMYSASLTPHLGEAPLWKRAFAAYLMVDQSYVMAITKFETEPEMTLSDKLRYYFGTMILITPVWYAATLAGALLGKAIPPELALDFAVPITFLAMVAPMVKSLAHLAAALVSVTLALALAGLPYALGLLVAAIAAMITGALVETAMARRQA
ncbi:MAG: AzlC family ABC transporter permease [Maritimibacter sp.]